MAKDREGAKKGDIRDHPLPPIPGFATAEYDRLTDQKVYRLLIKLT